MQEDSPFLSVIVPTHRRPDSLRRCLRALARQDYPGGLYEVIVVNDGADPPALEADESGVRGGEVRLVMQEHAGPATARNRGAELARGEYLLFTDDDCEPEADWLSEMARALCGAEGCAVAGRTVNGLPDNLYSAASQSLVDYLFGYYNSDPAAATFLTSNNMAMPAEGFRAVGGFATNFRLAAGEDRELCDRWVGEGRRLVYARGALVRHFHGLGLRSFWRQHRNYGRGAYSFHRLRASRRGGRVRIEPFTFYLRLVLEPFGAGAGWRAPLIAALLLLSQAANAYGFFREKYLDATPSHAS